MGRAGRQPSAQGNGTQVPVLVEQAAAVDPRAEFGLPVVHEREKEIARQGVPMDAMAEKVFPGEFGIHPMNSMNPDSLQRAIENRDKIQKQKEAMGYNRAPIVVGASPNAPHGAKHINW